MYEVLKSYYAKIQKVYLHCKHCTLPTLMINIGLNTSSKGQPSTSRGQNRMLCERFFFFIIKYNAQIEWFELSASRHA